jgi:hypothetical protein
MNAETLAAPLDVAWRIKGVEVFEKGSGLLLLFFTG